MGMLSDISDPALLIGRNREYQAKFEEIDNTRRILRDIATVTSFGRKIGGDGSWKVVGEIPTMLAITYWFLDPTIFMEKKALNRFLDQNPQFRVNRG